MIQQLHKHTIMLQTVIFFLFVFAIAYTSAFGRSGRLEMKIHWMREC